MKAIGWIGVSTIFFGCLAGAGDGDGTGDNKTTCGDGTSLVDGECVVDSSNCPEGSTPVDGVCVQDAPCAEGTEEVEGECVPVISCGQGTIAENGSCVPQEELECGNGTVEDDGECVPEDEIECGEGTIRVGDTCVDGANGPGNFVYYEEQLTQTFCESINRCCDPEDLGGPGFFFLDPGLCSAFLQAQLDLAPEDYLGGAFGGGPGDGEIFELLLLLLLEHPILETNEDAFEELVSRLEADQDCQVSYMGIEEAFFLDQDPEELFQPASDLGDPCVTPVTDEDGGIGDGPESEFLEEGGCVSGLYCAEAPESEEPASGIDFPGVCLQKLLEDDACIDSRQCEGDLYCDEGTSECSSIPTLGESCEFAPGCEGDLFCNDVADECQAIPGDGEVCADAPGCEEGFFCDGDTELCAAIPAVNESCATSLNQCEEGAYCDDSEVCKALPIAEEQCLPDGRCADGHWCDENVCAADLSLGDSCDQNIQCGNELVCIDLRCAAVSDAGGACGNGGDSGTHCADGSHCSTEADTLGECLGDLGVGEACEEDGDYYCEPGLVCALPLISFDGPGGAEEPTECIAAEDIKADICDVAELVISEFGPD